MIFILHDGDIFCYTPAIMDGLSPKILVVFSNIDPTHRLMLEGILRYVREKCAPMWQVQLELKDIYRRNSSEIVSGGFSGIIAAVINPADRQKYFKTKLPTVLFEPTFERMDSAKRPSNNVTFFNDHAAEGRAAAEYFLDRGYRSFAYVGTAVPVAWSVARQRGYTARLRKSGLKPITYPNPTGPAATDLTLETPLLARWLRRLPRGTAIFAAHDLRAQQLETAARKASVRIPEDVALLGVDDDRLLCETASPPISSIPVYATETGWRFAEAMHGLLNGEKPTPIVRTCHTRVITRLSTDSFALDDPVVAKALAYAESHLSESLHVEALAKAANCSARTLQAKVMRVLGRTVKDQLAYLRRREALKLLRETSTPVADIARICGYCSASHLGTAIRRATGKKPLAIRRGSV